MDKCLYISSEMLAGYVFWCAWPGYCGYAYFSGVKTYFREQQLQKDAEGTVPGKRGVLYYVSVAAILAAMLYSLFRTGCFNYLLDFLVLFPPVSVGTSVLFNVLTIVSNRKHRIGIKNGWSKAAMIYTVSNVFIIPICYAFRAGTTARDHHPLNLDIEPGIILFVYFLLGIAVYMIGYYFIMYFHKWIGGYKEPHGLLQRIIDDMTPSSGAYSYKPADYSDDTRNGNTSWGSITDDYYGKHGEFYINDEARRISEDMQQFHNVSPDADLTDHYYWDDVLDAETDGYLEDDE